MPFWSECNSTKKERASEPTLPNIDLNQKTFKSLCDALINNITAEPGLTIPVWSGATVSQPGSEEIMLFKDGVVTINAWVKPAFRNVPPTKASHSVFDEFLSQKLYLSSPTSVI